MRVPQGHYNSFLEKKNGQVTREAGTFTLWTHVNITVYQSFITSPGWPGAREKENPKGI